MKLADDARRRLFNRLPGAIQTEAVNCIASGIVAFEFIRLAAIAQCCAAQPAGIGKQQRNAAMRGAFFAACEIRVCPEYVDGRAVDDPLELVAIESVADEYRCLRADARVNERYLF